MCMYIYIYIYMYGSNSHTQSPQASRLGIPEFVACRYHVALYAVSSTLGAVMNGTSTVSSVLMMASSIHKGVAQHGAHAHGCL